MDVIFDTSTGTITTAALTTLLAFGALLFIYLDSKKKHSYWTERGIKGPKPWPLIGNLISIFATGNRLKKELEWVKKYGKVYGVYFGNSPYLVVADPEVLIQICVKDFEVFPNHASLDFMHKYLKASLFNLKNDDWKRTRALMSPTFTSGKIRRMYRFLDGCSDDLVQGFNDQLQKQTASTDRKAAIVNVKDQFSLYAIGSIATCCYGLKLERAGSANSINTATKEEFRNESEKIFKLSILKMMFAFSMPKPLLELIKFKTTPDKDIMPLVNRLQRLINQRRNLQKKFDDYLQLLIDARLDDQIEFDDIDLADMQTTGQTQNLSMKNSYYTSDKLNLTSKASLTDFEILANATSLLAAGIETTSTLLSHCTYALAFHPTIQEHLYDELMKLGPEFDPVKKKFKFYDYNAITSCKYLDAVVSETLRLMSQVIWIDRTSRSSYYLKKYNLALPQGSVIQLAYYAMHNDPDYWPNANCFDPDRFLPENRDKIVPGSFSPFGIGPRHCLGMRFSLTESKLALAKLIAHFRFEPAPNTEFPGEPKRLFGFYNIKNPFVTATPRIDTL